MSNDVIARARAAVAAPAADPAGDSMLVARTRATVSAPPRTITFVAAPPRPERVTLKGTCLSYDVNFSILAERDGNRFRVIEIGCPKMTRIGGRQYTKEVRGLWRCPACQGRARAYEIPDRGRLHGK